MKKKIIILVLVFLIVLSGFGEASLSIISSKLVKSATQSAVSKYAPGLANVYNAATNPLGVIDNKILSSLPPEVQKAISTAKDPKGVALGEVWKKLPQEAQKAISMAQKAEQYLKEAGKNPDEYEGSLEQDGTLVIKKLNLQTKKQEEWARIPKGWDIAQGGKGQFLLQNTAGSKSPLKIGGIILTNSGKNSKIIFSEKDGNTFFGLEGSGDITINKQNYFGISNANFEMDKNNQITSAKFTSNKKSTYGFNYNNKIYSFTVEAGGNINFDPANGQISGDKAELTLDGRKIKADHFDFNLKTNQIFLVQGGTYCHSGCDSADVSDDISVKATARTGLLICFSEETCNGGDRFIIHEEKDGAYYKAYGPMEYRIKKTEVTNEAINPKLGYTIYPVSIVAGVNGKEDGQILSVVSGNVGFNHAGREGKINQNGNILFDRASFAQKYQNGLFLVNSKKGQFALTPKGGCTSLDFKIMCQGTDGSGNIGFGEGVTKTRIDHQQETIDQAIIFSNLGSKKYTTCVLNGEGTLGSCGTIVKEKDQIANNLDSVKLLMQKEGISAEAAIQKLGMHGKLGFYEEYLTNLNEEGYIPSNKLNDLLNKWQCKGNYDPTPSNVNNRGNIPQYCTDTRLAKPSPYLIHLATSQYIKESLGRVVDPELGSLIYSPEKGYSMFLKYSQMGFYLQTGYEVGIDPSKISNVANVFGSAAFPQLQAKNPCLNYVGLAPSFSGFSKWCNDLQSISLSKKSSCVFSALDGTIQPINDDFISDCKNEVIRINTLKKKNMQVDTIIPTVEDIYTKSKSAAFETAITQEATAQLNLIVAGEGLGLVSKHIIIPKVARGLELAAEGGRTLNLIRTSEILENTAQKINEAFKLRNSLKETGLLLCSQCQISRIARESGALDEATINKLESFGKRFEDMEARGIVSGSLLEKDMTKINGLLDGLTRNPGNANEIANIMKTKYDWLDEFGTDVSGAVRSSEKYIGRDLYKGEIYEVTTSGVAPDLENVIRRNTMTLDITPEEAMSLLPDQVLSRSGSKIRININKVGNKRTIIYEEVGTGRKIGEITTTVEPLSQGGGYRIKFDSIGLEKEYRGGGAGKTLSMRALQEIKLRYGGDLGENSFVYAQSADLHLNNLWIGKLGMNPTRDIYQTDKFVATWFTESEIRTRYPNLVNKVITRNGQKGAFLYQEASGEAVKTLNVLDPKKIKLGSSPPGMGTTWSKPTIFWSPLK